MPTKKRNPRVRVTFTERRQGIALIERGLEMIPYDDRVEALRHVLANHASTRHHLVKKLISPDVVL